MTDDTNDDELERRLARALRDAFPESTDTPSLLPAVRKRARRRRQRLQGGAALGAAVAVAAAIVVPTTLVGSRPGRSTSSGAAGSSARTHPSPAKRNTSRGSTSPWTTGKCLVPGSPPAPQFVGLTLIAARRLATKEGIQLVILGQGGHCAKNPAVAYLNGVNLEVDMRGRVIAAQHRS